MSGKVGAIVLPTGPLEIVAPVVNQIVAKVMDEVGRVVNTFRQFMIHPIGSSHGSSTRWEMFWSAARSSAPVAPCSW